MKTYQKILSIILSIASLFLVIGISAHASTLPTSTPTIFETYLANQQAIGDVSLVLANGTLRDGSTFTGYQCVTIDSNTPITEYECGMASGTVMTSLSRGITAVDGVSTSSALVFAHRRGADVKVSDYPVITQLTRIANGSDTFPGPVSYASTVGTSSLQSNSQNLATVGYVNNTAFSGAGVINATTGAQGVVQLATPAQAGAGTKLGSTGASLALASSIASSTASTTASIVVVASATGLIDPSFISGSTFSNITLSGTTTVASTSLIIGQTPVQNIGKSIWFQNVAGSYTFTMPTGTFKAKVMMAGAGGGGGGTCSGGGSCANAGGGIGGVGGACYGYFSTTTVNASYTIILGSGGSAGTPGSGVPGGSGGNGGASYMSSVCTANGGSGSSPGAFGGGGIATASSTNSANIDTIASQGIGGGLGLSSGGVGTTAGSSGEIIIEW